MGFNAQFALPHESQRAVDNAGIDRDGGFGGGRWGNRFSKCGGEFEKVRKADHAIAIKVEARVKIRIGTAPPKVRGEFEKVRKADHAIAIDIENFKGQCGRGLNLFEICE